MSFGPALKALFKFHKLAVIVTPWLILAAYWLLIFTATHLPASHLPDVKIIGKDKTMHFMAYCGLALVFWLSYYRNARPSFRQKRTWLVIFTLVAYGVFDEITQKYVGRTTDVTDLLSDSCGIITALIMLFFVRDLKKWLFIIWAILFTLSHWPTPTHFIELPEPFKPLNTLGYMGGYCIVTMMWWRCLNPKKKFMINKFIFIWTVLIMGFYSIFDQLINVLMKRDFSSEDLTTSLLSVMIGIIASALFGLQNQAEENYQKYLKHLEEDQDDMMSMYDDNEQGY